MSVDRSDRLPTFESIPDFDSYWESSESMSGVESNSVDAVVTSPPYWNLKDYGHEEQIGYDDPDYDEYLDRLDTVWNECYRILQNTGSLWVVVNSVMDNRRVLPLQKHIADRLAEIGFHHQRTILWYKPANIAGMNDRNLVDKKEYILYFSLSDHETHLPDAPYDGVVHGSQRPDDGLTDFWRVPVKRGSNGGQSVPGHKAPFPRVLARRMIGLGSPDGGRVCDPFLGSGTTAEAALEMGRSCVGYEVNPAFASMVEERLDQFRQRTFDDFW